MYKVRQIKFCFYVAPELNKILHHLAAFEIPVLSQNFSLVRALFSPAHSDCSIRSANFRTTIRRGVHSYHFDSRNKMDIHSQ